MFNRGKKEKKLRSQASPRHLVNRQSPAMVPLIRPRPKSLNRTSPINRTRKLSRPVSSAQPDDEGHYDRLEKVSKIAAFTQVSYLHLINASCHSDCLKVMSIVSAITTYFSHSNYATHHLKEELKKEKDSEMSERSELIRG